MSRLNRILKMSPGLIVKKILGLDEIYTIAYREKKSEAHSLYMGGRHKLKRLPESKEFWYADPMVFRLGTDTALFMEAFEYKKQKGCIAYSMQLPDGTFSNPETIIEEDYHMSFPVVFEWGTELYMMPETSENKSLNLYKCIGFPRQWEKAAEFKLHTELVDAIILDKSDRSCRILASQLNAAEPLQTRFQIYTIEKRNDGCAILPHSDYNAKQVFSYDTRNAGNLFQINGEWRHPVQVSTEMTYGVRVDVFRYQNMEQICCSELFLGSIEKENISVEGIKPGKMIGIHSYCRNDNTEIVDVRYYQFCFKKWYFRMQGRLLKSRRNRENE